MKNNVSKRNSRNPFFSGIIIIIVAVLLFYMGVTVYRIVDLKSQKAQTETLLNELTAKKLDLENEVRFMDTTEYIETQARNILKMIFPDEILFVPANSDAKAKDAASDNITSENSINIEEQSMPEAKPTND